MATIDGEPLLATVPVSWALTEGTRPYITTVEMERSAAVRVFDQAKAGSALESPANTPDNPNALSDELRGIRFFELRIETQGLPPLVASRVYVLSTSPTADPSILSVMLADRRVWWTREHLDRAYNIRRRTGERRRLEQEGVPIELQAITDDVHFQPWSLAPRSNPTRPWRAREVVEDVLMSLTGGEFRIDGFERELEVENLIIDDAGDVALQRVMSILAGAGVYADLDGTIVVFDRRDGGERGVVEGLAPPLAGPGLSEQADLRLTRPREVHVLFTRELEVRLDTLDEDGDIEEDVRQLENVAPVPDVTLDLAGNSVAQGTWARIDDLFAAWGDDIRQGQTEAISHDLIQKTWFVPGVLQAYLDPAGAVAPDVVLARRVATTRAHYRQTYRIERVLLDRLSSIRAYRVAILDEENATRAPAMAFADWSVFYTLRGSFQRGGGQLRLGDVFRGFDPILADARVAPARVSVLDEDQGIIRVDWLLDPFGDVGIIAPGAAVGRNGDDLPEADPRRERADDVGTLSEYARLEADFAMAVVLTVTPGAPNDDRRLHRVIVTPQDASAVLRRPVGTSQGPRWEIRISPALETARFAWDDTKGAETEAALGVADRFPDLEAINEDRLKFIAEAAAGGLYAGMLDRLEGNVAMAMDPSIKPRGSMANLTHSLAPDGTSTTAFALPPELEPLDVLALLPEGVRRLVLGLVDRRGRSTTGG